MKSPEKPSESTLEETASGAAPATEAAGVEKKGDSESSDRAASLLSVRDLRVYFDVYEGLARAVDGVSFDVYPGEIVGIVGESGCGKSVTSMSLLRLLPEPPAMIKSGEIRFGGRDILKMSAAELRALRGNEIAMIFQEPQSALNPVFTIETQMAEAIRVHEPSMSAGHIRERLIQMLSAVRIPEPEKRLAAYPHELSGGMKQRVMIAMAMLLNPKLLIADEPTTALDVTIQRQILDLIRKMRDERGVSVILITHDLGVIAQICSRVMVMYAGRVVETGTVDRIFDRPAHPYTRGLIRARPKVHRKEDRLSVIPGRVPPATAFPPGCRFAPRCEFAKPECREAMPELQPCSGDPGHQVACVRAREIAR